MSRLHVRQIIAYGLSISLMLTIVLSDSLSARAEQPDVEKLVGQPAELSAWAYAYRADLNVQEKPEACFILRRLERLDRAYRPVSLLLSQGNEKEANAVAEAGNRLAVAFKEGRLGSRARCCRRPSGVLKSALLWEGRMHLNRLELHWPKNDRAALSPAERRTSRVSVMVRLVWLAIGSAA